MTPSQSTIFATSSHYYTGGNEAGMRLLKYHANGWVDLSAAYMHGLIYQSWLYSDITAAHDFSVELEHMAQHIDTL